jgi:hypothetical protein
MRAELTCLHSAQHDHCVVPRASFVNLWPDTRYKVALRFAELDTLHNYKRTRAIIEGTFPESLLNHLIANYLIANNTAEYLIIENSSKLCIEDR